MPFNSNNCCILRDLLGDAELEDLLGDAQQIDRMVLFERKLALVQGQLGVIPKEAGAQIDVSLERITIDPDALASGVASSGVPDPALV